jgi:hypothetical protein
MPSVLKDVKIGTQGLKTSTSAFICSAIFNMSGNSLSLKNLITLAIALKALSTVSSTLDASTSSNGSFSQDE